MGLARVLTCSAALGLALGLLAPSAAQTPARATPSAQTFTAEAAALRRQSGALAAETQALGAAVTAAARAQALRQEALSRAQAALAEAEAQAEAAQTGLAQDRAALETLVINAFFARAAAAPRRAQGAFSLAAQDVIADGAPAAAAHAEAQARLARRREAYAALSREAATGEVRLADLTRTMAARSEDHQLVLERIALTDARAETLRRDPQAAGRPAPRLAAALFGPGGARTVLGPSRDRPGVIFAGAPGQPVTAPEAGRIGFAGPLRGYGEVLIIGFDSGLTLVFAGLDGVQAEVGDTVEAGAVIGSFRSSAAVAPELYIEVRRSSRPVDPERAAQSWAAAAVGEGAVGVRP